ncbi:MAG: glutathione peroxidase [Phycisphaerales bacterium]
MTTQVLTAALMIGLGVICGETMNEPVTDAMVLDHEADRITGETERLDEVYEGKVVLIVNVASRCGYTKQYRSLEELYRLHKDDGFEVLAFPANDFGGQEPGSNDEILEFCRSSYDVTFPMFAKIAVTGDEAHPLYDDLRSQPEPIGGEPRWNFTKFLVDRSGRVVARFESAQDPMGEVVLSAVEEALAAEQDDPEGD